MIPRSPALALAFALAACGDTVFLGDLVAPDGSVDFDGGRDGGRDGGPDGGDPDGGTPELVGRYQLVFQSNPARVICTGDLEDLADPLGLRTAVEAGLADGYTELAMAQDYLALSGLDTRANFTADPLVLTRETRRPTVFTGAAAVDEPDANGMTFVLVVVQIETSDPESGILRSNVQHKLERAGARGQCTVDYQLTLYACGIGC